ncbi:ATPase [Streptomyces sp. A7024]|uniref:ATPase n=1 Tax=Streptomyces coryli TaxID=1128680 RepID=A0A6G4TV14_9ACTN|nr:BadF/BadG/BcrA/BcrD ATPase family protein [Streptomyces coryli]NGN63724.1 ATPase [Streptomyces coryli]
MSLVIGIDAGGTRLRAALASPEGVLATAASGAGNPRSVTEAALADHLTEAIAAVCPPQHAGDVRALAAGFAGARSPSAADPEPDDPGSRAARAALATALRRCGVTGAAVRITGDIEIALAAGPGGPRDGLVVVAGTGAAAARIRGGLQVAAVDGHGWLLGDEGSGFWIARRGLRAAVRALDGSGPPTALVRTLVAATGSQPDLPAADLRLHLIDAAVAHDPPPRLASLCPVVVRTAEEGDDVAAALLDEAANRLLESLTTLRPEPGEPLVTTGGLLGPAGPLLSRFTARTAALGVHPHPVPDGLAGALVLGRSDAGHRALLPPT